MSLLLNKPSKLCPSKQALIRSSHFLSNGFSSSSLQFPSFPTNGCRVVIRNVTKGLYTCLAKKEPVEPVDVYERNWEVESVDEYEREWEACHGWLATFNHDRKLRFVTRNLETVLPKFFESPPFVTLPRCQTQIVTNVVMSSPYDEDDCVVAVKFLGPQLSFFRPAQRDLGWTNIRIENSCFYSSEVIFSKKDNKFRILGCGGHVIGSWDPHKHKQTQPKIQRLRLQNLPERTKTQRELLESCCTRDFLVESESTDEIFLVKLFRKTIGKKVMRTKGVMVFKLDHEGNAIYTQDIGDLFIFLTYVGNSCQPAANYPPPQRGNCVEVVDEDDLFLYVHLASGGLDVRRLFLSKARLDQLII